MENFRPVVAALNIGSCSVLLNSLPYTIGTASTCSLSLSDENLSPTNLSLSTSPFGVNVINTGEAGSVVIDDEPMRKNEIRTIFYDVMLKFGERETYLEFHNLANRMIRHNYSVANKLLPNHFAWPPVEVTPMPPELKEFTIQAIIYYAIHIEKCYAYDVHNRVLSSLLEFSRHSSLLGF